MPIFDDDGNEIDITKVPIPRMCRMCLKLDDEFESYLCDMNRSDQRNSTTFACGAFVSIYGPLIDDIIQ